MITRKEFLHLAGAAGIVTALPRTAAAQDNRRTRPNILWLSTEDIGPHIGCYGDPNAITPTIDKLAAEGLRYENAFTTAPVCAPNRSSIITGMYAVTLGTHHMRSGGEGVERSIKPQLPPGVKCFSEYLREAGYYCTNNRKEDYNFPTPETAWDSSANTQAHWKNRADSSQPFFAVFNYKGTHEGSVSLTPEKHAERTQRLTDAQRQDPDRIVPPPYHPNTPATRRSWANYHELITALDYWVADRLKEVEDAGEADNTIVFFWSDHGAGVPRNKRWLYDSGTHIPLIVRIPERLRTEGQAVPGTVEQRLISSLDFAPTVLNMLDFPVPEYMQGHAFLGPKPGPARDYVYAARDRMDERYDMVRMVRDERFQYIRNYEPFKPYDQYTNTAEKSPIKREMNRLASEGKLMPPADWILATHKPVEELFDTDVDPHEVNNLAADPKYAQVLKVLRAAHERWVVRVNDLGLIPEPELVKAELKHGNRAAILPALMSADPSFMRKLRTVAARAGRPQDRDEAALIDAASSSYVAIRYWAVTGLGNLDPIRGTAEKALVQALTDDSPTVRVAAAQALARQASTQDAAVALLEKELKSEHEWVRLHAALALDNIGEAARPVIPALKEALADTHNKYVVRVANRALNDLLGTNNQVR